MVGGRYVPPGLPVQATATPAEAGAWGMGPWQGYSLPAVLTGVGEDWATAAEGPPVLAESVLVESCFCVHACLRMLESWWVSEVIA